MKGEEKVDAVREGQRLRNAILHAIKTYERNTGLMVMRVHPIRAVAIGGMCRTASVEIEAVRII